MIERVLSGGLVWHVEPGDNRAALATIKARGGSMADSWKNASGLSGASDVTTSGRWPANVILSHADDCDERCAEGCAVAELGRQSGESTSKSSARGGTSPCPMSWGAGRADSSIVAGHSDTGTAARFFYCAKPSARERDAGLDDLPIVPDHDACGRVEDSAGADNPRAGIRTTRRNTHPTVKPIEIMRYLVRLVTPPGGVVLDPFAGSGTTGVAAALEGARFVGLELEPAHVEIARRRIAHWAGETPTRPGAVASAAVVSEKQLELFA